MDSHVRERERVVSDRRQALWLGAALVAVPASIVTLATPPQERLARALKEIEAALAEIYPGAYQRPIVELPKPEAFASPVLSESPVMSGRVAMVSVTADSFHQRYGAGLVCREDPIPLPSGARP
ncbi:hypothetical protein AncyloWKF20_20855 [Ancylobacter sp. WKF20]|uniref:hypothetical protein n=1 Tax=Ancylobacter sp. WKF20 TaxID=3039801 RepID=UPI0024345784|nr:hypothetical protein [Ancylobacter sp. WKF20]WGD30166.1 hypothetical protein AncyloWKF20_20855 [Ancylobacter sp. WKF20]